MIIVWRYLLQKREKIKSQILKVLVQMNYQQIQRLIFRATDTGQQARQRRKLRKWIWIVGIVAVIVGGRFILFKVEGNPFQFPMNARNWTGFGESYDNDVSVVSEKGTEKGTEKDGKTTKETDKIVTTQKKLQPAKTLWDWMALLLAPATLAGLGFLFQSSQEKAKRDKEEADKKRDLDKEEADKKRDADQQREQALQAYFEQLSVLLVDKRLLKLLDKEEKSANSETEASSNKSESKIDVEEAEIDADAALNVVKAKTLALFRLFDNAAPTDMPRKASVLAFLGDSGLLEAMSQILDLSGSHWEKANLRRANLSIANLSGANLSGADLTGANLSGANLTGADLTGADFIGTNLMGTNLMVTKLIGANLSGAKLSLANLSGAKLICADLNCADLNFADLNFADLTGAKLAGAKLQGADLRVANLSGADLRVANLSGVKLGNANFSDAILSDAILLGTDFARTKGLIQQQLEGEETPLLCNVKLPEGIAVDPNRDCKRLPEVLLSRYPEYFENLEEAQKYVGEYSNRANHSNS